MLDKPKRVPSIALAVMAALASPSSAEADGVNIQSLVEEISVNTAAACDFFPEKNGYISVNAENILKAYQQLQILQVGFIPPTKATYPELANQRVKDLLTLFGYTQFENPVSQFQKDLGLQFDGEVGEQTLAAAEQLASLIVQCATIASVNYQGEQYFSQQQQTIAQQKAWLEAWTQSKDTLIALLDKEGGTQSSFEVIPRIQAIIRTLNSVKAENIILQAENDYRQAAIEYLLELLTLAQERINTLDGRTKAKY